MEESSVRKPAVAGQFYPASMTALKRQIEGFADEKTQKIDAIACLLPHAGYIYSGRVAALTVSRINIKDTVVLLGPNHTGFGPPFSIMTQGLWRTPLGDIQIDTQLANKILVNSKHLENDASAHRQEHSLEVELPIFQYFKRGFKIVPVVFSSRDNKALKETGEEIAGALKESNAGHSSLIVASSDLTHYEPQLSAEKKDRQAIEAILELDEDKLTDRVKQLNISMCGAAPVTVMLKAAKILGAKKSCLIKYQTSGEITADKDSVVGYAGIIIY